MPFVDGCPFGGRSSDKAAQSVLHDSNHCGTAPLALPVGKARIQMLYEEYVHLPHLRAVWDSPITSEPVLEPCFAAGMHGVELGFLLLAEFLADDRRYVAKQPRIERVASDIEQQCRLLTEVIDGELEEEGTATNRLSLTQSFPFPGAPPTSVYPGHSPGLQRFESAARTKFPTMVLPERNSLIKVVINLTAAFASFQRWSVGVGIEPQLDSLRAAVGLPPAPACPHAAWLDYDALVRPQVTEETLTGRTYTHPEDFFFRTVHLGTECWARIALARLRSAADHAACGHWHVAASRILQASRVLDYLGDHVLLLTSMNLRDYLLLKVELEGTSGEGSTQVRALRPLVAGLLDPLAEAVPLPPPRPTVAHPDPVKVNRRWESRLASSAKEVAAQQYECGPTEEEERVLQLGSALMVVYEFPDCHRELYNYSKALECAETALLGGFYFKHFLLAANVIGSDARGTMRRSVAALKATYERPVFPVLDRVRSGLGAKVDAELAPVKGKMMTEILDAYLRRPTSTSSSAPSRSASRQQQSPAVSDDQRHVSLVDAAGVVVGRTGGRGPEEGQIGALDRLYSWDYVPNEFRQEVAARMRHFSSRLNLTPHAGRGSGAVPAPLAFLDHAWGQMAPCAMHAALVDLAALHQLGNPAWNELFACVVPQASAHICELLEIPPRQGSGADDSSGAVVHWGHNTHELVFALLSERMMQGHQLSNGGKARPLRVLTSDCEFYSFTRQLNRLAEDGAVAVQVVPADPASTFAERCTAVAAAAAAGGRPYDVIYVSQVTYLSQQTLLRDVPAFVAAATAAQNGPEQLLVIIDGYHAFCAYPTALGPAAESCCYVGGLLKHAGCGANCAFITVPRRLNPRPACTGWLADPSVLAAGSEGVSVGSQVSYAREVALQGGTPAFLLPLLAFNHLMAAWAESGVTVSALHAHVIRLHQRLLGGLLASGEPGISLQTLLPPQPQLVRSHTLVFEQPSADDAKAVVEGLARQGVLVDSRKCHVRVGFGPNHTAADVDALLAAIDGK